MSETILTRIESYVAIVTLNRPHRHNAMDDAMSAALGDVVTSLQADPDVRVILLRGEGPSFCTGRDTASLGVRHEGVSDFAHVSNSQKRKFQILDSQKPFVAAVRGFAIGGGCELALQCDIRIASETARFSLPEIDHGIITDGGGSVITAAIAGPSRAKYMLMTGEKIDAQQALQWGLVDFVVPDDALDTKAFDIAAKIAARPPIHVAIAKQLIDGVHGDQIRRGLREELVAITALYKTADRQEARAARAEKRTPSYKGL
jgi:enoyl-CoA hydratase/carnithine racemase